MTAAPALSIVIVAWRAEHDISRCLGALGPAVAGRCRARILIIDNGGNGELAKVAAEWPNVHVVGPGINRGYGAACNRGARASNDELLLFMNPDVFFEPGAIAVLVDALQAMDERVAAVGPKLVSNAGETWRSCARFPTVLTSVMAATGLEDLPYLRKFGAGMVEWEHDTTRDVDQLIGAALLMRRAAFERLNGFDENFFVYYEEVDLCLRLSLLGYKARFVPHAVAYHTKSGSASSAPRKRSFYNRRSRCLYGMKNMQASSAVAVTLSSIFLEAGVRGLLCSVQGNLREAASICAGTWDLCRWLAKSRLGACLASNRAL